MLMLSENLIIRPLCVGIHQAPSDAEMGKVESVKLLQLIEQLNLQPV